MNECDDEPDNAYKYTKTAAPDLKSTAMLCPLLEGPDDFDYYSELSEADVVQLQRGAQPQDADAGDGVHSGETRPHLHVDGSCGARDRGAASSPDHMQSRRQDMQMEVTLSP